MSRAAARGMLSRMNFEDEAAYVCPSCGEEIEVPVEPGVGREQEYVEDCPVCCSPNVLTVRVEQDGQVHIDARAE